MASAALLVLWGGTLGAARATALRHVPSAPDVGTPGLDPALLEQTLARAAALPRLHALLVARHGVEHVAEAFRGPGLERAVNIKSVSKSVMAALVGARVARGMLAGVDQQIAPLLDELVPADADPRVGAITIDHLLTMRAGLERTSGRNYGRWVSSKNWVRFVLSRPFVDEPGGRMLYSTGSYHLLSAVLDARLGPEHAGAGARLARRAARHRDPALDPRSAGHLSRRQQHAAVAARAAALRRDVPAGRRLTRARQVLPGSWIEASWTPRARSASPATPTATAGSSPPRADIPCAMPGATAAR